MESHSKPDAGSIEWNPVKQLLGHPGYEFILITLNQPIRDRSLFEDLWNSAETKIAADGGANQIYDLSKEKSPPGNRDGGPGQGPGQGPGSGEQFQDLDTIIGDLDSLTDEARRYFSRSRIALDPDQYSTDFAKAVRLARRASPGRALVCVGGLGGRVDQGLSQLHHLYLFQKSPTYAEGRVYLVSGDSLSFVLKGGDGGRTHRIRVREPGIGLQGEGEGEGKDKDSAPRRRRVSGDPFAKYVGIVPVGEPAVITTRGLEWDVEDWPTAFGGKMSTSNHVLPETEVVEVRTDKDVLFTIALRQGAST
ncbi:thiamine pyrophosphokinase [Nemania serpens]|nr:thiamine pyrophosphokinase [Nemania serpens]